MLCNSNLSYCSSVLVSMIWLCGGCAPSSSGVDDPAFDGTAVDDTAVDDAALGYADAGAAWEDASADGEPVDELDENRAPKGRDDDFFVCGAILECLRDGNFGRGTDNYSRAASCVPPLAPGSFRSCINFRGGLACFDRWPGCPRPAGFCDAQRTCIQYGGGLSCFAKYPCENGFDRDACRLYGRC